MKSDLAEGSFLEKWPGWIRWILFLPAAVSVSLIGSTLYKLIISLVTNDPGLIFDLFQSAMLGALFVFIGAATAPKYQFGIAIFLMIVFTLIIGGTYSLLLATQGSSAWQLINAAAGLLGGGYVVYTVHSELINS